MQNDSENNLLSVQQAAKRLSLCESTVHKLIKSGRLKASDFATNGTQHIYRIRPEWVDDLIAESEIQPVKPRVKQSQNLRPSKFATIRRHG